MSLPSQLSRRELETTSDHFKIVPLFQIYCDSELGPATWKEMMQNSKFASLMDDMYPKYDDLIFHDLVNIVSSIKGISIKKLLKDFNNFINTYYTE